MKSFNMAVTADERTLFWTNNNEVYAHKGFACVSLLRGIHGTLVNSADFLYIYSIDSRVLMKVTIPEEETQ